MMINKAIFLALALFTLAANGTFFDISLTDRTKHELMFRNHQGVYLKETLELIAHLLNRTRTRPPQAASPFYVLLFFHFEHFPPWNDAVIIALIFISLHMTD